MQGVCIILFPFGHKEIFIHFQEILYTRYHPHIFVEYGITCHYKFFLIWSNIPKMNVDHFVSVRILLHSLKDEIKTSVFAENLFRKPGLWPGPGPGCYAGRRISHWCRRKGVTRHFTLWSSGFSQSCHQGNVLRKLSQWLILLHSRKSRWFYFSLLSRVSVSLCCDMIRAGVMKAAATCGKGTSLV